MEKEGARMATEPSKSDEDLDTVVLQESVSRWTKYWRLVITCTQATILGGIAMMEHRPFMFVLAALPFPIFFMIQVYERRLEKKLFRDLREQYKRNLKR